MTFLVFTLLFVGLCGWLDSRLHWRAQRESVAGEVRCRVLVENAEQQQEALAAGADSAPLKGHRAE